MPKGPRGEKRPADVIGNAITVAKIATGETEETFSPAPKRAAGGKKGGKSRSQALSKAQRTEIAKKGAAARWGKSHKATE
jgi:hypothetical protein